VIKASDLGKSDLGAAGKPKRGRPPKDEPFDRAAYMRDYRKRKAAKK